MQKRKGMRKSMRKSMRTTMRKAKSLTKSKRKVTRKVTRKVARKVKTRRAKRLRGGDYETSIVDDELELVPILADDSKDLSDAIYVILNDTNNLRGNIICENTVTITYRKNTKSIK